MVRGPALNSVDCIVVGGGVIGMATARELARRGRSVRLLERGALGREASWAAGGILSSMRPWAETAASAALSSQGQAGYSGFAEALRAETGIDPEYYRCGMVIMHPDDVAPTLAWAQARRVRHVRDHRPAGLAITTATVFLPAIAQVRVPRLLQALHASLKHYRVEIREHTAVTEINTSGSRFTTVTTAAGEIAADALVITTGAWSGRLLGELGRPVAIEPVRGQMVCVRFAEPRLDTMILDGDHYFIPRKDGHVLIGSTMERVGFDKRVTDGARATLMDWAGGIWPDVNRAGFVRHWAGLRPATDDGRPRLGRLSGYDNVFINAGHFRKGILQAPICASRIAALICG